MQERWLVGGDFNLIYRTEDKNNHRLNRNLMGRSKAAIDVLTLKELLTWTSSNDN
jgi:hypothetical protein